MWDEDTLRRFYRAFHKYGQQWAKVSPPRRACWEAPNTAAPV